MKLADFVVPEAVIPDLSATERDEAIQELLGSLVDAGVVKPEDRQTLMDQVLERENKGSTGFGKGVAVPHVKHEVVTRMAAAIGVSQRGVDFNALDRAPVYSIVLLLSPKDRPDDHLQAMENIFSNLQKDTFRSFLRQASTREAVLDLLSEADAQQLTG